MKLPIALPVFACLAMAGGARAAEWSATPVLSWSMDHDTNRLMIEESPSGEAGYLQLDLLLKRSTGSSILAVQPHVGWREYTNANSRDGNQQSLLVSGTWIEDRSILAAQASYTRDNTLESDQPDSGVFLGGSRRRAKNAGLSWSHEQSDNNHLDLQLAYSDVRYEDDRLFEFFGLVFPYELLYAYKYPSISATQSMQWSPRSALQFSAYAARLITADTGGDSDSYGARVGISRSLTTHLGLFVSAGVSRQSVGQGADERHESGYIGRFELTHKGELNQWRLYAERNVSPGGYGFLVTADEAGLGFERRLAPRWSTYLSARTTRREDITADLRNDRRRWERADAGLGWQASRAWRVALAAAFTRAQQSNAAPLVHGWSATASAVWAPRPRTLSR